MLICFLTQESYTIPDSQPSSEKGKDVTAPFDEMVLGPSQDVIDDIERSGTVTPKAKQILALPPPAGLSSNSIGDSSALLALREYQSNITSDGHVSNSFIDKDPPATKLSFKRRSELHGKSLLIIDFWSLIIYVSSPTNT